MTNPFSEVAADPRLFAVEFHQLGDDQVRVVGVDRDGAEIGRIPSVSAHFAQILVAEAGITLGDGTVRDGGNVRALVVPRR